MIQNETATLLPENTTDAMDLDSVDRAALACLNLDTISVDDLAAWLYDHGATHLSEIERIELAERLTRRRFIIGTGGLLGAAALGACGASDEAAAPAATVAATRTVTHAQGEAEAPVNPQRIVVLDSHSMLDCVVSLGFTPVGIGTIPNVAEYAPWLEDKLEDSEGTMEGVLTADYAPNLEKITTLQPDLILGWSYQEEYYAKLAEIAPTVMLSFEGDFKTYLEKVSETTGTEGKTEALLARYEERVESVRAKVAGTKVSVVRPQDEALILYGPPSNLGSVLTDLGLEIQPVPKGVEDFSGDARAIGELSLEYIPELSGEHIFLISYDLEETVFEDVNQAAVEELLSQSLWQQLKAVQEGRVHSVQGLAWTNHGPLGAIQIIDDVERALAGTE